MKPFYFIIFLSFFFSSNFYAQTNNPLIRQYLTTEETIIRIFGGDAGSSTKLILNREADLYESTIRYDINSDQYWEMGMRKGDNKFRLFQTNDVDLFGETDFGTLVFEDIIIVDDVTYNVGIGQENPSEKLDILGDLALTDGTGRIRFKDGNTERAYLGWTGSTFTLSNLTDGADLHLSSNDKINFFAGNILRMRINDDGKVGIGGLNAPEQELDVFGDIALTNGSGAIEFREGNPSTLKAFINWGGTNLTIENDETNGDLIFDTTDDYFFQSNNSTSMFINQDGNVGIGTTTPDQELDVDGDIALTDGSGLIEFKEGATQKARLSYTGIDLILENNETDGDVDIEAVDNITFRTSSTDVTRMFIGEDGDIGIGTVSPSSKLHVNGKLTVTGSDFAERFNVNGFDNLGKEEMKGMLLVIDENSAGDLKLCETAYDRKVAGIVSGAGGVNTGLLMGEPNTLADGNIPVAISGRVYCRVDANYGAIEIGDFLTTSSTTGHAMKVKDFEQAQGAIIGKAMTSLKEGKGLVLVLISMQ
ncbi:MAG: hypothetical protein AAF599_02850 [Bacteroidota bacterium]